MWAKTDSVELLSFANNTFLKREQDFAFKNNKSADAGLSPSSADYLHGKLSYRLIFNNPVFENYLNRNYPRSLNQLTKSSLALPVFF